MAARTEKSKILLCGLGAIGGFYAFILSRVQDISVTVVARSNYQAVKENGLHIDSANHGKHTARLANVLRDPADAGERFDFVVLTTKAIGVDRIIEQLQSVVSEETTIVIIQNGVGNEDPFRKAFPMCTILSCVTWVGAQQPSPGMITHIKAENTEIGLFPNRSLSSTLEKSRLDSFTSYLRNGGTSVDVIPDIQVKRWEKLVWNAAWNPLTALTMLNTKEWLNSSPAATSMTRDLMREVIEVGKGCGVALEDGLVDVLMGRINALPPLISSMYTDAKKGRPLELEVILGTPFRKGKELGLKTPVLDTVYALTNALDHRLRIGKS